MPFTVTAQYTDELIRLAARRFLVRYALRDAVVVVLIALFTVAGWLAFDLDWKMPVGVLLFALVLLLIVLFTAMRYIQQSVARFRALKDTTGSWQFSDDFISTKNELGSSEYRWSLVTEVWRFPEVWLFLYGTAGYSLLPAAGMSEEAQAFVLERVKAHGGKVI